MQEQHGQRCWRALQAACSKGSREREFAGTLPSACFTVKGVLFHLRLCWVHSPAMTPPTRKAKTGLRLPAEQAAEGGSGLRLPVVAAVPEQVGVWLATLRLQPALCCPRPKQCVRRWPTCTLTPKTSWHTFYRHATLLACVILAPLSVTKKSLYLTKILFNTLSLCRRRAQLPPGFVAATDQACLLRQQAAEDGKRLITLFERFMRVRPLPIPEECCIFSPAVMCASRRLRYYQMEMQLLAGSSM